MNAIRPFTQLAVLLALLTTQVACSAVLGWNENGLPCDTNVVGGQTHFCRQGYHCQDDTLKCIRDGSLAVGEACTQAVQCQAGLTCPIDQLGGGGVSGHNGVHECLPACLTNKTDGGFFQADGCADVTHVCLPFLSTSNANPNKALRAGCLPTAACTPNQACSLNANDTGTCVAINAQAQACLPGCEITWTTTPSYTDNCDALHSCVPVGMEGQRRFVCLYNGSNSTTTPTAGVAGQTLAAEGAACSPVLQPCAKGMVCAQGVCARYCQLTSNTTFACPTGQSCCQFSGLFSSTTTTGDSTGYCATSCR